MKGQFQSKTSGESPGERPSKLRLVVLGSGFGSFSFLKQLNIAAYDVTLISPRNHFLFTPLLPSTIVGTIEFRSIIEPVRHVHSQLKFYMARAQAVDMGKKLVQCRSVGDRQSFTLPYDRLVIGVGEGTNTFHIEGVEEHALFLKELSHGRRIRTGVLKLFEEVSLPTSTYEQKRQKLHLVVVGGGPTGIEIAAELHDFVVQDVCCYYPDLEPLVRVTLVEAGEEILTAFDQRLRQAAERLFKRQRISILTGDPVVSVNAEEVRLSSGKVLTYGLLLWATGNAPHPFVLNLPFPHSPEGRLVVDQFLRIPGQKDIYALGDCAAVKHQHLLPTAQVAMQQGKYLARVFNGKYKNRPFVFRSLGMLAYVGSDRALVESRGLHVSGRLAWLFWRSVYLTRLVRLRNKVRVLVDWLLNAVFGRDVSQF